MELKDLGLALQAQLEGSRESLDQHAIFTTHPLLLSRLVSKLTYCVREAPVRYVAVDMSSTDGDSSFEVSVYTDSHLFHLTYDPAVDHLVTRAISRDSIRMVELLSAPNFMAGNQPGTYQGSLELAVTYQEVFVHLPGDNHATEQNRAQLDAFFPTLLADLPRSRR